MHHVVPAAPDRETASLWTVGHLRGHHVGDSFVCDRHHGRSPTHHHAVRSCVQLAGVVSPSHAPADGPASDAPPPRTTAVDDRSGYRQPSGPHPHRDRPDPAVRSTRGRRRPGLVSGGAPAIARGSGPCRRGTLRRSLHLHSSHRPDAGGRLVSGLRRRRGPQPCRTEVLHLGLRHGSRSAGLHVRRHRRIADRHLEEFHDAFPTHHRS